MTAMSAAIMAHPQRARFVEELQQQLDRPLDVVWDERNDRWGTGRRSMLAHDPAADWHLVLQDDAVPSRDLIAGIERACAAATAAGHHGPLAFYAGRQRPLGVQVHAQMLMDRARRVGATWMQMEGPWWGVAIAVPTDQITDMVAWGDQRDDPTKPSYIANYDKRISRYYASRGIDCWYSVPSLVDHRDVNENPSLVPGRIGNRKAHMFLGASRSALDITWTAPPVRAHQRRFPTRSKGALVSLPDIAAQTVTVIDSRGLEVRVVAGRRIPAHLRAAYAEATAVATPSLPERDTPAAPVPERSVDPVDEFDGLRRPDLLRIAKELGVPGRGTNAELIANLRAARAAA